MTLELTGERTLPGIPHENYWLRRHEAAYHFAAARCGGLDVLDAGCGEGYGTAILAHRARRAWGVDLAGEVVRHARAAYPRAGFVQAEVSALPLAGGAVDAVVSLQVVEHLWDVGRFLDEVVRVLRPGGWFLCGTPNRLTFSPGLAQPANPFHTVEFSPDELAGLLGRWFGHVEVSGVFHAERLTAVERARAAALPAAQLACEPGRWPPWLRATVAAVGVEDFLVAGTGVAASLDLLAVATAPRRREAGRA